MKKIFSFALVMLIVSCTSLVGPAGPAGADGRDGKNFSDEILTITGVVTSANYRARNPQYASVLLPGVLGDCVICFAGVDVWNNGAYIRQDWDAVVADSGWRLLVWDSDSSLIGKSYKVQYLP